MTSPISIPPGGSLQGRYRPPGDKSVSHRAVMIGALAKGTSYFKNFLESQDCLHTLRAFQNLGIRAESDLGTGSLTLHGKGMEGLSLLRGLTSLDMGNSGTSMRLMMGILAGQKMEVTLTGDASLSSRPMKRVTEPLKMMGAQIKGKDGANYAPLTIRGGRLKAIDFNNHLGSAQVKSAILFAGLYAEGVTRVREEIISRDHTERLLEMAGAKISREDHDVSVEKTQSLIPLEMGIPGDISSASFFIVGTAMVPGAELEVENVGLNPTRTGLLEVLKRMGASVEINLQIHAPEPSGSIFIRGSQLKGTRIEKKEIPSLIDELPILMVAMALADGESLISGAEELRVKETDRIAAMASDLRILGAEIKELPDGCVIRGRERLSGGQVASYGDHRTAMSMAIAALACEQPVVIDEMACIETSYPSFLENYRLLRTVKA